MKRNPGRKQLYGKSKLFPLLLCLLAAAGLFLGFLQFRWVTRVSMGEKQQLEMGLKNSAFHVLNSSNEEVRVLQALLHISAEEFVDRDWTNFEAAVDFWRENSRFPDLYSEAYLIASPDEEGSLLFLNYSLEQVDFSVIDPPPVFKDIRFEEAQDNRISRDSERDLLREGVLLSRLEERNGAMAEQGIRFAVYIALQVNAQILYTEIIPYYMDYYLEGYPYRIVDTETEINLFSSGIGDPARVPEISLYPRMLYIFKNPPPENTSEEDKLVQPPGRDLLDSYVEQVLGKDPSFRFWVQRSKPEGELWDLPPDSGKERDSKVRLDIYYPGASISSLVSTRRMVNLTVSIGVLLLLVAGSIVLFRLYRNITRLRSTEQEFVASMSHELRTPITVLQATSENLISGVVADPQRVARYGGIIHKETKRLAQMVEGILLYSGLEKRTFQPAVAVAVNPMDLVREITTSLQEPAEKARCEIKIIEHTPPGEVYCDPTALRLIIENLLINAVYHGLPKDSGGGAEVRLVIEGRYPRNGLVILVEDDGPGILPKEARRIFEPFVRGTASVEAQRPGSGLGLHLVRQVAGMLGGTITLESPYKNAVMQMQAGCRFILELPSTKYA
jgi:signal transduction histidine kinase